MFTPTLQFSNRLLQITWLHIIVQGKQMTYGDVYDDMNGLLFSLYFRVSNAHTWPWAYSTFCECIWKLHILHKKKTRDLFDCMCICKNLCFISCQWEARKLSLIRTIKYNGLLQPERHKYYTLCKTESCQSCIMCAKSLTNPHCVQQLHTRVIAAIHHTCVSVHCFEVTVVLLACGGEAISCLLN